MNTVFVYADGKVGQVALPDEYARQRAYRVPRRQSMKAFLCPTCDDPSAPVSFTYDEYTVRGQMFDGRPVFCAEGFDVKEAYQTLLLAKHECDVQRGDGELRRSIERFIRHEYQNAIELDRWAGAVPFDVVEKAKGYEHAGLAKRGIRVLIAVRT